MPLTNDDPLSTQLEISSETKNDDTLLSTPEEIARLAYAYWEERGRPLGSAEEDWFRAERELRPHPGTARRKTAHGLRLALIELELDASSEIAT
jgi:hypothetical protein